VLAATTNGTSASQTFGISSGTSNCTDNGVVASKHQAALFIENNRTALANDISRGNGETLTNFSALIGCQNNAQLGRTLKSHYQTIFTGETTDTATIQNSIANVIRNDQTLSTTCKNVAML
jgi:hypothetical protein